MTTPKSAFNSILLPEIIDALDRGAARGNMWKVSQDLGFDAAHTLRDHAQMRIAEAIHHLDYMALGEDREEETLRALSSAVGYIAVAVAMMQRACQCSCGCDCYTDPVSKDH